jgi:hypothetical protein
VLLSFALDCRLSLLFFVQGSLLIYWQLPSASALRSGLQLLRQPSPSVLPALASTRRLLTAGLMWPSLPPVAIRAILAAADEDATIA